MCVLVLMLHKVFRILILPCLLAVVLLMLLLLGVVIVAGVLLVHAIIRVLKV